MRADQAADPELLRHFEGVVRKTAALTAQSCEEDFEDICQVFRVTVWKALLSFESKKTRTTSHLALKEQRDRYVYACLKNRAKDFIKQVRRNWSFIEDIAPTEAEDGGRSGGRDRFDSRYLRVDANQVFNPVEDVAPLLPLTLDRREQQIVELLLREMDNGEIAEALGLKRKQVATLVRGIRVKMSDFAPSPRMKSSLGEAIAPISLPVREASGEPVAIAA